MNRVLNDNALLRDVERLQDVQTIYKTIGMATATFIAVGFCWFLCVAVPAKALWQ
ncbi:hypothetical protein [Caballeronia sp. LZ032]|uniref:hypothetical protein n=1 Tax=Caballeronia sp. LZ032 TaxID=3038565 RepID=UPI00285CFAB5|nr:hypothetical protein [Caballeronia sp. LZ032]MDR5881088.1 hypothetical protein [Caballeronia sp. LZ032]